VQWREDLMNGKNEALLAAAAESRFNSTKDSRDA